MPVAVCLLVGAVNVLLFVDVRKLDGVLLESTLNARAAQLMQLCKWLPSNQ